jgi:hypothetical protein
MDDVRDAGKQLRRTRLFVTLDGDLDGKEVRNQTRAHRKNTGHINLAWIVSCEEID